MLVKPRENGARQVTINSPFLFLDILVNADNSISITKIEIKDPSKKEPESPKFMQKDFNDAKNTDSDVKCTACQKRKNREGKR